MTDFKGTRIIAIDHGYGNIKTANTVTPTAITAYDSPPVFTGNILEYEGRWYRIGEGHKEFTPDKAIDEDYYLLTLMAIARELNQEHITDFPVKAFDPFREIRVFIVAACDQDRRCYHGGNSL